MSQPTFHVSPGAGQTLLELLRYSQAVRVGDRVEISGQGGWYDDITFPEALEDEIVQAFDNVERVLATAGAGWQDVISLDSFHVLGATGGFEEHNRVMVEQYRRRLGDRAPIWTQLGVSALGDPHMHVEIRVTAVT